MFQVIVQKTGESTGGASPAPPPSPLNHGYVKGAQFSELANKLPSTFMDIVRGFHYTLCWLKIPYYWNREKDKL